MTCRQKKSSDLSSHWLLQRAGGAGRHEPHVAAVTPSQGGTGDVLSSALSESLGARSVVDPGHVTQPRGSLSSLSAFSPEPLVDGIKISVASDVMRDGLFSWVTAYHLPRSGTHHVEGGRVGGSPDEHQRNDRRVPPRILVLTGHTMMLINNG